MRSALILSTLAAAACSAAAQTTVLLDDFSEPDQTLKRNSIGTVSDTGVSATAIAGAFREAGLEVHFSPFAVESVVEIDLDDTDTYSFASGAANTASSSLLYDAATEGLGLELRSESVFDLSFLFADKDFELTMTLLDAGGNQATATTAVPDTASQTLVQITASELDAETGFDLGDISSVRFDFNVPTDLNPDRVAALDFILDSISVTTPPIPAPASAAIAGAGLFAAGTRRRR